MSRTQHARKPMDVAEQIRLDDDLRIRIARHHERVESRLEANRSGVRTISRAEVIRSLLRSALDVEEGKSKSCSHTNPRDDNDIAACTACE